MCEVEMTLTNINLTYRKPFSNISSVKPSICINSLRSLLGLLQIALEHVRTLHTHLEKRAHTVMSDI